VTIGRSEPAAKEARARIVLGDAAATSNSFQPNQPYSASAIQPTILLTARSISVGDAGLHRRENSHPRFRAFVSESEKLACGRLLIAIR
jgi:hypothetical protein